MMGRQLDSTGQPGEQINDSITQNPAYSNSKKAFITEGLLISGS